MILRKATQEDIDEIASCKLQMMQLHEAYSITFCSKENVLESFKTEMKSWLENPLYFMQVAEDNDQIVGYIIGIFSYKNAFALLQKRLYISDIFVSNKNRKKGVGRLLFLAAKKAAQENDIELISLAASIQNEASVGFWKSMGFEPISYMMSQVLQKPTNI